MMLSGKGTARNFDIDLCKHDNHFFFQLQEIGIPIAATCNVGVVLHKDLEK